MSSPFDYLGIYFFNVLKPFKVFWCVLVCYCVFVGFGVFCVCVLRVCWVFSKVCVIRLAHRPPPYACATACTVAALKGPLRVPPRQSGEGLCSASSWQAGRHSQSLQGRTAGYRTQQKFRKQDCKIQCRGESRCTFYIYINRGKQQKNTTSQNGLVVVFLF